MLKNENKDPNEEDLWSLNVTLTMYNNQPAEAMGPGQAEANLETYRSNLTAILMTPEVSSAGSAAASGVLAKSSARRAFSSRVISS